MEYKSILIVVLIFYVYYIKERNDNRNVEASLPNNSDEQRNQKFSFE